MKGPRIGALRHRVVLEAPSRSAGEGGGAEISWHPVATLWAEVVPLSGSEIFQADSIAATAAYEVCTRFRPEIAPEMRFVLGERILDIRSVRDIEGRRRWVSCLCEERNP